VRPWAVLRALAFLAIVLAVALPAAAVERVVSFHSNVRIAPDGWLAVTETIAVNVEGRSIQRGILRDFPTDYRDSLGRKVTVPFQLVAVLRDGAPEPVQETRLANGVSLRIGNGAVRLPLGVHTYQISYRTRFQVGFFPDHDELYWNVNGNGWTFAMDEITAEVSLPGHAGAPVPAAALKAEAYTGAFGARGRSYEAKVADGGASFRTTRPMAAGEGLTIVLSFPKGIVAAPTFRERFDRWLHDNRGEVAGAGLLLLLCAFVLWRWWAVGRDPDAGPAFPRYEAPRGLGPAGARMVYKMGYDNRCFSAGLLGLGQRGFLRIEGGTAGFRLKGTGAKGELMPGDAVLAALAPTGESERAIGGSFDPAVQLARQNHERALRLHMAERYFSRNGGSLFVAGALAFGATASAIWLKAAFLVIAAVAALAVAAFLVARRILPAYTREGRRLEDDIEGLRQYLGVAEKDDLARQKRPPRTAEEFAKFLPWAVALDVERAWTGAFERVLGAAAVAAATQSYYSSSSTDRDGGLFGGSGPGPAALGDGLDRVISSSTTPPGSSSGSSDSGSSSSGSDSGGSSGGGGGGGGGSGW